MQHDFDRPLFMISGTRHLDQSLSILRYEERPWGLLVHAVGAIPIWGFVFSAGVWLYYRHRSREMIFHVQQAVQFHIFILLPILAWILIGIMASVVHQLSPALASGVQTFASFLLAGFLAVMALTALTGGLLVYLGRPFLYPLIGRRVLQGTVAKLKEE